MSGSFNYDKDKESNIKMEFEIKQENVYHECGICDERFPTYSGLEFHSKIHSANLDTECIENAANAEKSWTNNSVSVVARKIKIEELNSHDSSMTDNKQCQEQLRVQENGNDNAVLQKETHFKKTLTEIHPIPKIIPDGKIDINEKPNSSLKINIGKGYSRSETIGSFRKKMAPKATKEMLENPFRCGVCWQIFNEGKLLTEHLKSHEEPQVKVSGIKCMFCYNLCADEAEFQIHLLTHSGNLPYVCNFCQVQFLSKADLDEHRRTHKHEAFKCDYCSRTFSNLQALNSHIPQHEQDGKLECNVCNKKFTRLGQLKVHVRLHIGDLPYKCKICDKAFNSNNHLDIHTRSHTGEKPYKCDDCDECFTSMSRLQSHKNRIHTKQKPFSCDICGKSFFLSHGLVKHMTTHTGEKPFKCSECPKSFARIEGLDLHHRTHSGEKPYKCNYCEKSFTVQSAVNAHIRWHTGEKKYKCDVCDARFNQSSQLWSHKRVHFGEKNNKCDVCGKSFVHVSSLKRHIITHSEDRPFKCDICKHGCKTRADLNRHVKTHSGEKPYKCGVCDKSFSSTSHIKRHISSVHKMMSVESSIKRNDSDKNMDSNVTASKSELKTIDTHIVNHMPESKISNSSRKRSASQAESTRRSSRLLSLKRPSMAEYLSDSEDSNNAVMDKDSMPHLAAVQSGANDNNEAISSDEDNNDDVHVTNDDEKRENLDIQIDNAEENT